MFLTRSEMMKSTFYRQYMAPQKCLYALGLFFWSRQRLIGVIVIMRTAKQSDLAEREMKLLQHLYPQFQTALRRLGSLEREHSARATFEEFLRRLPLPTVLLRWNLKLAYQNRAAREFCALWQRGPKIARLMKANVAFPSEILDGCRALKQRWERFSRLNVTQRHIEQEMVHHPQWPYLRATLSLKQLSSAGVQMHPIKLLAKMRLRLQNLKPDGLELRDDRFNFLVEIFAHEKTICYFFWFLKALSIFGRRGSADKRQRFLRLEDIAQCGISSRMAIDGQDEAQQLESEQGSSRTQSAASSTRRPSSTIKEGVTILSHSCLLADRFVHTRFQIMEG